MWVAAVVLYGYAVRVCPLVGERPCRRGCWGPGYVRRVVWGYRVKPGGEPCLLVGGGGGGGGAVVGGDEVQQGPRSVEGCRAAVPARAWYALVTLSDWWYIGLRCIVHGLLQRHLATIAETSKVERRPASMLSPPTHHGFRAALMLVLCIFLHHAL